MAGASPTHPPCHGRAANPPTASLAPHFGGARGGVAPVAQRFGIGVHGRRFQPDGLGICQHRVARQRPSVRARVCDERARHSIRERGVVDRTGKEKSVGLCRAECGASSDFVQ
jgi:hypothetical protein